MSEACDSVGIGVTVDPETQRLVVLFSLHREDLPADPLAFATMEPQSALLIGSRVLAAAQEAERVQEDIDASNDPTEALADWIDRFQAGMN